MNQTNSSESASTRTTSEELSGLPAFRKNVVVMQAKDPVLALLLSLFPGGGQIYNGHLGKALLAIMTYPLFLPFALYDAYSSAKTHNLLLHLLHSKNQPPQLPPGSENHHKDTQLSSPEAKQLSSPPPTSAVMLPPVRSLERKRQEGTSSAGMFAMSGFFLVSAAFLTTLSLPVMGMSLAFLGILFALSGAQLGSQKHQTALPEEDLLIRVVQAAGQNQGTLSQAQVVQVTGLTFSQAEEFLDSLAMEGKVELRVEENGGLLYDFPDLQRPHLSDNHRLEVENKLLQLAREKQGYVTLGSLALDSGYPLNHIQFVLGEFCNAGIAHSLDESDKVAYWFPEFDPSSRRFGRS